ncbi:hypothetical protein RIF29_10031 [Crotalaria pallida]|uniref:NAC domain-containing protein n=1 Tax=Crotalaria pallida TaxID=3830 RepID=A0AAN9IJW4_CROPI
MEKVSMVCKEEGQMDLPPGFRFHPTDEELISHYLYKKVTNTNFSARAIGDVDLNRSEPWDLPWKAKMGEKEWYFFCVRDRKYPTGLRTNRATEAGYWKATGKDREIYRGKSLVGMKKTLVFYKGRAPNGEKTNWVMHEYRLEGKFNVHNLPKTAKNEWVICRVFQKSSAVKKTHISGIMRLDCLGNELGASDLPPLTNSSPSAIGNTKAPLGITESAYVPCFSNPIDVQRDQLGVIFDNSFNNNSHFGTSSNPAHIPSGSLYTTNQGVQLQAQPNLSLPGSVYSIQDQTILRALLDNHGSNLRNTFKSERETNTVSQATSLTTDMNPEITSILSNFDFGRRAFDIQQNPPAASAALLDHLATLWNF